MMNDIEEDVGVDTQLPEDPFSPLQAGGDAAGSRHGEVLSCRRCQAASVVSHKFCPQCGEPLWEPCVHCGTVCPAGERFCGSCGANLVAAIHQQTEQFEMNLLTVERLQAEGRYEEAIALLGPISGMERPRLSHHAKLATDFIKRLTTERQQKLGKAEEVCRQGRHWLDQHDYRRAIRLLEEVPVPLRNEEFQALLAEAKQRRHELASLGEELRAALEKKTFSAVLPKIARLLELKPTHAQARQLAEQIQKQFTQTARAKIAEYRYEEAARLLRKVPESVQTAEAAALRERTDELAWIAWDLRHAAVVDAALVAVASRLQKLSPGDPRGAKLGAENAAAPGAGGGPGPAGPAPLGFAEGPDAPRLPRRLAERTGTVSASMC